MNVTQWGDFKIRLSLQSPEKNLKSIFLFSVAAYTHILIKNIENLRMETPTALNVTPLNAPHKELESLPLADRDYLIQDLVGDINHL